MKAFIFLNGGMSDPRFYLGHFSRARLEGDVVICADGGYEAAARLGITPDLVVGDLDSLGAGNLPEGVRVLRHPPEKDFSDFEIALGEAKRLRPRLVTVYGALGGRADHELVNLLVLAHAGVPALFAEDGTEALNVPGDLVIEGKKGWTCTLAAAGGPCRGVRTRGLLYPLRGERLTPSGRGLSNVIVEETARIRLRKGSLLVLLVRPSS
jgi:thiamine pyrophosphokinase